jgi:hypothetical protein
MQSTAQVKGRATGCFVASYSTVWKEREDEERKRENERKREEDNERMRERDNEITS